MLDTGEAYQPQWCSLTFGSIHVRSQRNVQMIEKVSFKNSKKETPLNAILF